MGVDMDRSITDRLADLTRVCVVDASRIGSQHGVDHYRVVLADDRTAFAKVAAGRGHELESVGFAAEAAGLRWLRAARAVPVPAVLAADERTLVIEWLAETGTGRSRPEAAAHFGADLARLHSAGAEHFGAPWPGVIASLPLPNAECDDWPSFYARQRLLPYARLARDAGEFSGADVSLVESVADRIAELAGPPEPPSRIHGDCWSGNVLWSGGRGWLIDPAAHGGHRETDLAMLSLFGAPNLEQILASYQQITPLAGGWRDRVALHQLHPLLVHVCLFGGSYRDGALRAAQAALRA